MNIVKDKEAAGLTGWRAHDKMAQRSMTGHKRPISLDADFALRLRVDL